MTLSPAPATNAPPAVQVARVRKSFDEVLVLDDLSLTVEQGEFVSLLGPSGCGKTTLLRMIAGFIEPDAGHIGISGKSMVGIAPRQRNLGIVFQNYSLWPHMSVEENIGFGLETRNVSRGERLAKVQEVLHLVGLDGYERRLPSELSGGQKQRVAIARAIVYKPQVLLLDEPLSALDRKLRERMQVDLRDLQKRLGITTILVTHDQEEALVMSDRIAVMRNGRFEQVGRPAGIYDRPANDFVADFIGRMNFVDAEVVASDDVRASLCSHWGGDLKTIAAAPPEIGKRMRVMLRPERITMSDRMVPDAWPAVVMAATVLGPLVYFECRLDTGVTISVARSRTGASDCAIGSRTWLRWNDDDVQIVGQSVDQPYQTGDLA
jgi:spermidine/putrescine ABC transporter ATP-binding subunit